MSRISFRTAVLAGVTVALLAAAAATAAVRGNQAAVKNGGTLVVGLTAGEPDALDPTLARTFSGREVFLTFCEKLYDLNSKAQIVPQLASALPTISKDKLTVTIPLRTGIKFNDGTPFNAAAVVKTIERDQTLKGSARASEISPDQLDGGLRGIEGGHPPQDPVLAAHRTVCRPFGDDHVAGAARQAGRQVRDRPCLRRRVRLLEPRRRGQHHRHQVVRLLRQEGRSPRQDRLQGRERRGRSSRRAEGRRPAGSRRHRLDPAARDQERLEAADHQADGARLPGHHAQPGQQERPRQAAVLDRRHADRTERQPSEGVRGGDRPQGDEQGRLRRHGAAGMHADLAVERLVRPERQVHARTTRATRRSSSQRPASRTRPCT